MALQQWEVAQYENAAMDYCHRVGEDPYEQRMDARGCYYPHWMDYAVRMAEIHLMVKVMQAHGFEA